MERYKGYIVFPEAIEKLEKTGIISRIEQAKKADKLDPMYGAIYPNDVRHAANRLVKDKSYNLLPREERERFQNAMSRIFANMDQSHWKIDRNGFIEKEEVLLEDLLLLLGDHASQILKPEELIDYQKKGFRSFSEWVGCVGALVMSSSKDYLVDERFYTWNSHLPNGRTIINSIGGDMHGDLRIAQVEVTPYPTIDPLGNPVLYRPVSSADQRNMFPYHSTETSLLVAVLDYIDQRKVDSEIVKDKARKLIEEVRTGSRKIGNFAEAFDGPNSDLFFYFINYGEAIAELSLDGRISHTLGHGLTLQDGESSYVACITPDGNLGFYIRDNLSGKNSGIRVEFQSSEVDHLIKGLVHQATKGLGRTHPGTLANILEYRFSEDFERRKV